MNKNILGLVIASLFSSNFIIADQVSTSNKIEVFNYLNNNLNEKNKIKKYATKKYDFKYLKQNSVFSKIQVLDIVRILKLYEKHQNKAAILVLNSMIQPIQKKYIKRFEFLLKISDEIDNNIDILTTLTDFTKISNHDYFFVNEIVNLLDRAGKYEEGIFLLENIEKINNNFSHLIYRKIVFVKEPSLNEKIKKYLSIKQPYVEMENSLAYFYDKKGRLLDAYNTYKEYNVNLRNTNVISELYAQIKFRLNNFNSNEYNNNVKDFKIKIKNTIPFYIYKIRTK